MQIQCNLETAKERGYEVLCEMQSGELPVNGKRQREPTYIAECNAF